MSEKTMYGKAALDLENIEKEVDRLAETLKENGITSEELGDYMYNLHAEERNNVIRERNGSESGSGSWSSTANKLTIIEDGETIIVDFSISGSTLTTSLTEEETDTDWGSVVTIIYTKQ